MSRLTDEQLLEELRSRFEDNRKTIAQTGSLMVQLELVNRKLLESEALKSNFLSNIRNEINNPLAVLLGHAKNLSSLPNLAPCDVLPIAKSIYKEAFNLDFQFKNVFHAADIEAGDINITNSRIDIHPFIEKAITSFQHLYEEKKLLIEIKADKKIISHPTFFVSDVDKIFIIIMNLVDNAIKFSHPENKIIFQYNVKHNELMMSIRDFGIGIAQEDHKRIFDRFIQLDSGSAKLHSGHGLGLAVTKSILELLNGNIYLTSALESGSEFIVSIPESDNPSTSTSSEGNDFLFDEGVVF